jgi:hypothetical protein
MVRTQAWLWGVMLTAACSDPGALCTRDPECPDGSRCAAGRCIPTLKVDAGRDQPPSRDAAADRVVAPDVARTDGGGCKANSDDTVDRSEMPIAVGAKISYSVGSNLTVDLVGTKVGGRTQWDLTAAAADDHKVVSELLAVASWAAPSFAGATYMSLLDQSLGTYGVFAAKPSSLQLVGVISEKADQSKLSYSSPIDTLRFPVVSGDSYATDATVTGLLNWIYVWLHEDYTVDVLGAGDLKLPQLTLPTLLVRVKVVQAPVANPFLTTTRVTFLFVAECYGIVAQIVADGDPGTKLGAVSAKERRRITM